MIDFLSFHDLLQDPLYCMTGEQYGKIEQKYPEDGHCQSVLITWGDLILNVPPFSNYSADTAAAFNVVSHPRDTIS